ncbi:hypothetical protein F5Y18DRAFT_373203 [Xylariaceae sp. FL1019]|nr:hypothetical protein F5Y18DRAFT_373203 [Xylariaceae sp. FL1019]
MAGRTRLQVASGPWIEEERSSAIQIAQSEIEEFTFAARNDCDWLNEHMNDIFSENQINVAEIFKTPGKLRGKTPRTARKANLGENRVPLSNIFSSTPKVGPNPFTLSTLARNNTPRVKIAVDPLPSPPKATAPASPQKQASPLKPAAAKEPVSVIDSGYHGSQSQDGAMDLGDPIGEHTQPFSSPGNTQPGHVAFHLSPTVDEGFKSPTIDVGADDVSTQFFTAHVPAGTSSSNKPKHGESTTPSGSPSQPHASDAGQDSPTPANMVQDSHTPSVEPPATTKENAEDEVLEDPPRSPSDGSSPIRPPIRKSSLNFASLPAREPMTHKSIGNRVSRTSHLDQNRTSHYRHTGGKSLGHAKQDMIDVDDDDENDEENDDMDVDDFPSPPKAQPLVETETAATHNKTYTQRLQDQISKLGKSQANVPQPTKIVPEPTTSKASAIAAPAQSAPVVQPASPPMKSSPTKSPPKKVTTTPGAFPTDDEDDDWTHQLGTPDAASNFVSPRPGLPKSYSTDVMEGVSGKDTVGGQDFGLSKTRPQSSHHGSPQRAPMGIPERTTTASGHHKSMSVPVFPVNGQHEQDENNLHKAISVSNPMLAPVMEDADARPATPKSPSRGFNNSPLKQVKNKLSSILKSSRGLLASSAAISAEGKSSLLSPSTTRLGLHLGTSTDTLGSPRVQRSQPLYPDLSRQTSETQTLASIASPTRNEGRRTRASIEKEKAEEKRKKDEAKEARRLAEENEKLDKARQKEREKARVFSKEQERIAELEKQVASQKEKEKRAAVATPGHIPKPIQPSPRKAKEQNDTDELISDDLVSDDKSGDDVEMTDATIAMPPPSVPRQAPSSAMKPREIKRPVKPAKEPASKTKQAPTVIRVNMGSQHTQYHPSNSTLASNLQDTLSQPQLKSKASQPALQSKQSMQSLKSSTTSSSGRPKALEAAARRKEQEERDAQRKRDAKAEIERKRAAMQEEEKRQELQRKLEAERLRDEERKQAEAKKTAHRQAMLEKAKQTRAPPPAVRSQPNGPPDYTRPPSRMNSAAPDAGRPANTVFSNASKAQGKRPLQQEQNDDSSRSNQIRSGNGVQTKETKRMRMTDELNEPGDREKQPSLKGAPVRPSGGVRKELPTKAMFPAGYTNVPPSASKTQDLFKATVTNQHNSHVKAAAHPMDMAQLSKGAIPFASSSKTPARPMGMAGAKSAVKSATRSSPRFQNGESIELPEINTDDESDEDEDDTGKGMIADWADSPNLRQQLVRQESQNPFEVFGAPAPINMEEVFAKNRDRFAKFRKRTSSANWDGPDGLTEQDIRKDLAARDKMRREGKWTYDMGIDMA